MYIPDSQYMLLMLVLGVIVGLLLVILVRV